MKVIARFAFICAFLALAAPSYPGKSAEQAQFERFGPAYRLVFFAILEGLFLDGAKDEEVQRVLMKRSDEHGYEHFIYGCPICTAVFLAFEAYRARPEFWMYKPITQPDHQFEHSTFGHGFTQDVRDGLNSEDVKVRLQTLHGLVSTWIDRRMAAMDLTEEEEQTLREQIEAGRKQGEKALAQHKKDPERMKSYAPGYAGLYGCAMCNAVCRIAFEEILEEGAPEAADAQN